MGTATSVSSRFAIASSSFLDQAPGEAHIYEYVGGVWVFRQTLAPPGSRAADSFGGSLYIDDSTALVGAYGYTRPGTPGSASGAVYVFTRTGSVWVQTGLILNPSATLGSFGWTLDMSGRTAVVGYNTGLGNGEVHLFRQPAQAILTWQRIATFQAPTSSVNYDYGYSVAIHDNELVVGAIDRFGRLQPSASFYHQTTPGNWQLVQTEVYPRGQLTATTVAVHGRFAAIGSDSNYGVRIYERTATGWQLRQTLFSPDGSRGRYGQTVSMNGHVLLVSNGTGPASALSGVVYRYELVQNTWTLQRRYEPPQPLAFDGFGASSDVDDHSDNIIIGGVSRLSGGMQRAGQAFVLGQPAVLPAGPFCLSDPPVLLQATAAGGSWAGPSISNPATGLFSPALAGVGTHQVTYSLLAGSCQFRDTVRITVGAEVRILRPAFPALTCLRDTIVQLLANLPGGTWQGAGILPGTTGRFSSALAGPGRHIITYVSPGSAVCRSQDTLSVVVAAPVVRILSRPPVLCRLDTTLVLQASVAGGIWSGPAGSVSATGRFTVATAGPGQHLIRYRLGTGRCAVSDSVTITVRPLAAPLLQPAGPLLVRCGATSTELRLAAALAPGSTVQWQLAPAPTGPWQAVGPPASLTWLATQAGWYRAQTSNGSCQSVSAPVQVSIEPLPTSYIPNVFTPNADQVNDVFELQLPYARTFHLQIFDRWGRLLFTSRQYGTFWDGQGVAGGVYYYLVKYTTDCDAVEQTAKGHITLIR
ncbi:T9SS type B sorting domain-containing protein [Hymenobacter rigui]|nr:gliding motility-associated C-terminal domain-containing protein [Hymenobacter rigui]